MMFRVFIPGVGNIFVQAANQQEAITAAQKFIGQNGITLEQGAGQLTPQAFSAGSIPPGSTIIGADGGIVSGSGTPTGGNPPNNGIPTPVQGGAPTQVAQPTPTQPGVSGPENNQPVFPAGGTAGGGASLAPDPEEVSAFGQFRNFLRSQGLDPDSILGGTVAGQFQPFLSTFGLNQVLHNLGAGGQEGAGSLAEQIQQFGGPQSFLEFVQQQGTGGIANTALGALQGIAGQAPGQENTFLAALQQATPGSDLGNILQGAAAQALRTRLSPAVLGLFGNQAFNLSNRRFEDALAGAASGGGTAPTLSQHYLRSLGLL